MDGQLIRTITILTPVLVNFILLDYRKKKWVRNKYKWIVLVLIAIISICFYIVNYEHNKTQEILVQWAFLTPLIFSIIELLLTKLSYSIHNREFYLWLKGSTEIDSTKLSGGKHVRASDRIISFFLLITIFTLPFAILFFIDKD
jgi:hypothetical protein